MIHLDAAGYSPAYVCGLCMLLLLLFPHSFAHTISLLSLLYLFATFHIFLFVCILAQRLYDTDIYILNGLNFLFRFLYLFSLRVKPPCISLVMRLSNTYHYTRRFYFTKVFYLPPVELGVVFHALKDTKATKVKRITFVLHFYSIVYSSLYLALLLSAYYHVISIFENLFFFLM